VSEANVCGDVNTTNGTITCGGCNAPDAQVPVAADADGD
jgi:hypothetical protein